MPLFNAVAVSALLLACNVDAFAPNTVSPQKKSMARTCRLPYHGCALRMSTHSPPDLNFYKLLGVPRDAKETDIKKAYRRLAKLYHPDANPKNDTTEQFQALNRAYEVLSDPDLKKNYDLFGEFGIGTSAASDSDADERVQHYSRRRRPDMEAFYQNEEFFGGFGRRYDDFFSGPVDFDTFAGPPPGNGWVGGPTHEPDFSTSWDATMGKGSSNYQRRDYNDIGEEHADFDWFGRGNSNKKGGASSFRTYGPIIGTDIAMDFEVDFKTAVLGGPVEIKVNRIESCEACDGTGARSGTKKTICETCGGSGISIPVKARSGPIFSIACPDCRGTGKRIQDPCTTCDGTSVSQRMATVKVDIPAGVTDGNKVRIEGEGDVGPNNGPPGDLFLFLKVKSDPHFRRDGSDIHSDATITCIDAIVGTTLKIPVVDGEAEIEIPPGTQPGHVICIKQRGAASLIADQRGDHFVAIDVQIPNAEEDKENILVQLLMDKDSSASQEKAMNTPGQPKVEARSPHNFSVPFPTTQAVDNSQSGAVSDSTKKTVNASVPFPTAAPVAAPPSGALSTMIDNQTLSTLKEQASAAEEERQQRIMFEQLVAQREKEIAEQALRLKELEERALRESEERLRSEKLAAQREEELQESIRRQEEMNKEITIRIRQSNGQTTRITLKKSTQMSKIIEMIARQKGMKASAITFSFQGQDLSPEDTPFDLSMNANSIIEMTVRRATGGGVGVGVRY